MYRMFFSLLILTFVCLSGISAGAQYYYSDSRQIPLAIDSTKVSILFVDYSYNSPDFFDQYNRIDSECTDIYGQDRFRIFALSSADSLSQFIDSLRQDYRVALANPFYLIAPDKPIHVGRTICCKFNDNVTRAFIDSLNAVYQVDVVHERQYTPNQFLLSLRDHAPLLTLEVANIYYELAETEFSHPNFLGGYEWTSYNIYDHYWDLQWSMQRVFNASPSSPNHVAYEFKRPDSNIIVAAIDQGVEPHEDLPVDRFVPGYDFEFMDSDPTPCHLKSPDYPWGWHGQAVAGIVAASHNRDSSLIGDQSTGIYGMAPACKIMAIKIGSGISTGYYPVGDCWIAFQDDEHVTGALEWAWANGADILSCSWTRDGALDALSNAIIHASLLGRNGKGCTVVFGSGNNSGDAPLYPVMMPEVISVGATKPNDSLWEYSSYSKVDVVAPSGKKTANPVWSLDLMGEYGQNYVPNIYLCGHQGELNNVNYTCQFGGTSASQPVAAGVAALVLSRRPDLNKAQLDSVIRLSADTCLNPIITNRPNQKYGYGMVDPLRALLAVSRGDANNISNPGNPYSYINIQDIGYLITFLYYGGPPPTPHLLMGDPNCDGVVNLQDATFLVNFLYKGGPAPALCFKYNDSCQ